MRDYVRLDIPPGLWDSDLARTALASRDLAAVFRYVRGRTGASQTAVGSLIGLAQPDVSAIERGQRLVQSIDVLERIAHGLRIPPALLGLAPTDSTDTSPRNRPLPSRTATRVTAGSPPAEEDPVRRRDMMTGALGLSAGLLTKATPAAADPAAAIETALFNPPSATPVPLPELARALSTARRDYAATRYHQLATRLPHLIATAEATRQATTGHRREQAHTHATRAYVLATELGVKQRAEATLVAADRALTAGTASGDPQSMSEAARVLAIAMRRAGRPHAAVSLLARTATSLDSATAGHPAQVLAARACLYMTAAYTAAHARQRSTALELLQEAEETTRRIPSTPQRGGLWVISASLDQCAMYRVSTYTALDTPDDGVNYATRVIPARLPTLERRARYLTDTARMWHKIGDPHRTLATLEALERMAPEEARRPSVRMVTTDLLYTSGLPGIRRFAARTGALT